MFIAIAIVITSNLAFADILYSDWMWYRSAGPATSVEGDSYWAGATVSADGTDYWGWGYWTGMNFCYTTEAGNFGWGCDFTTYGEISYESQYTVSVSAYAAADGTGPASDPRPFSAATVSLVKSGSGTFYDDDGGDPTSPEGDQDVYIEANDGVLCSCDAEASAEVSYGTSDVGFAQAFAMGSGWIE
jgi:hypothetical protein